MADKLKRYRAKRDFDATPEPSGEQAKPRTRAAAGRAASTTKATAAASAKSAKVGKASKPAAGAKTRKKKPRFVVQEHSATRLHWDLRLEHDGSLASWALPRFFPNSSGDNRLAVRTEDHPLEYLSFEGDIPKGEYGAGTMRVYDTGTYDVLKWEPRKVEVEFHGERLTGRYALFPLSKASESPGKDWMIHRMGEARDPRAEPLPGFIPSMLARPGTLPKGAEWAFEIKWDGVRALVRSEPGRLSIFARSGNEITARYPELGRLNRALHEHEVLLDGEIVAFDSEGRPSFQELQRRMHVEQPARVKRLAAELPVSFVAFDLLWLDGHSLMGRPLEERRALLESLELRGEHWQTPEIHSDGAALLDATERVGLEGVVAKRLDSPYEPGRRSSAWIKVKPGRSSEFLVGGWLEGEGSRSGRIGALLIGEPGEDGALRYVGRAGTGFSERHLDELAGLLAPLELDTSPFAPAKGGAAPPAGAHWVEPRLIGEVAFTERSRAGILRHPVWKGLREDLAPMLVLEDERKLKGKGIGATARIGDRAIPVTNLDKVMYPSAKVTKRDVIEYYARIAAIMVPHLAGRALTLKRYPNGVDGQAFFEKRAPSHRPEWVPTETVPLGRETIDFLVANEPATLVWLAQLAALELHPSLALASEPGRPTVLVFDLDPGAPATIVECCRVALTLRAMFEGLGLDCWAKTSGSKGLQLYLPLNRPEPTFDDTKAFSHAVADLFAREEPDLAVATQTKTLRKGKVLIDWAQNDRAKTTVAVYSLRAREHPTVSTPVSWDEVRDCADSGVADRLRFTATQVLERVAEQGDLFAPMLSARQRLPAM